MNASCFGCLQTEQCTSALIPQLPVNYIKQQQKKRYKLSIFTLIRCYTCGYFHEPQLEDSRCSKLRKHFDNIFLSQNLFEYALVFVKKAANKVLSCLNRGKQQQLKLIQYNAREKEKNYQVIWKWHYFPFHQDYSWSRCVKWKDANPLTLRRQEIQNDHRKRIQKH